MLDEGSFGVAAIDCHLLGIVDATPGFIRTVGNACLHGPLVVLDGAVTINCFGMMQQRPIEDEEWNDQTARRRTLQRGMVSKAQISTKPNKGAIHPAIAIEGIAVDGMMAAMDASCYNHCIVWNIE